MTARDALREGAEALRGSETPFLDASLILAELLSLEKAALYAALSDPLDDALLGAFRERLALRASGLCLAYILGRKEFWGRSFIVDPRVLVPRPDTELLVAAALARGDSLAVAAAPVRVHEACCGSLCVAASIAADRPAWEVSASDLSEAALEVAAANAAALLDPGRPGGICRLTRSDLLASIQGDFDLILANPPYVASEEAAALLAQGWGEPPMALDGGADGLDAIRELVPQAASRIAPGGYLLVEADPSQAADVAELFSRAGLVGVEKLRDLGDRPRVTVGRKAWTS